MWKVKKLAVIRRTLDSILVSGANAVPRFSIKPAWMKLGLMILFVQCMLTPVRAPQKVSDLEVFLVGQKPAALASVGQCTSTAEAGTINPFEVEEKSDRLIITHSGKPVTEFVFHDERILRPYFANVFAPNGLRVTRRHPPIPGVDAMDHDTMHPGIWLAFGDISGHDFWRNKGRIEHLQFIDKPKMEEDRLKFSTESKLVTSEGKTVCMLNSRLSLTQRPGGWLMSWDSTFHSDQGDFSFGDQEEMGFGARMATSLCEKQGGVIVSSTGRTKANNTWGQPASWCDYSGPSGDQSGGITLMAAPMNFRESWWHNRDYGLMVANPFGRAAMKQGSSSEITVKQGELFRIVFGAWIHDGTNVELDLAFQEFMRDAQWAN